MTDQTLTIRRADQRGRTRIDWLDSWHSFSFGQYRDPDHMGFGSLRVINDDVIAGGGGFPEHPHRNMEIITWMVQGELAHRDSLGHGATLKPGEVQVMTAGRGIYHSEFNASPTEPARLLQVWIQPSEQGLEPRYDQAFFADQMRQDRLCLIVSGDGRDGSLRIHQDVLLYVSDLSGTDGPTGWRHAIRSGRHAWLQVVSGQVQCNDQTLTQGDAASLAGGGELHVTADQPAQVLLFDLA